MKGRDIFTETLIEKLKAVKKEQELRESVEALFKYQEKQLWRKGKEYLNKTTNRNIAGGIFSKIPQRCKQSNNDTNKYPQKSAKSENRCELTSGRPNPTMCQKKTTTTTTTIRQNRHMPCKLCSDEANLTIVGYSFCGNPVPFQSRVYGKNITLGHFKMILNRKGNYRYFFKKASNEFGTKIVYEELTNDKDVIPLWEGKIFGLVEEIEEWQL